MMFKHIHHTGRKRPGPMALSCIILVVMLGALVSSCNRPALKTRHQGRTPDASVWPQDNSDLKADESIEFGRLNNGLRFAIKENKTPEDRVSMHLFIRAGSLNEYENEQGIAHFLEHMLFNGSKHFPPGEMVKYFQRIGMQFGPDANAHTGFDQTVYDVLLPRGDEKSLSEGLLVLRDYADGALLLPEEVEREKKVVLAEMRTRNSAAFRTLKASFRFEMPDLIVSRRFPIGDAAVIQKMDHQMLRRFYEAWYRPERMFLVLVGDLDKETAKRLIAERFADLTASLPPRPLPAFGRVEHEGVRGFHHFEKDAGATRVSIETIVQEPEPMDSKAYQLQVMKRELANAMMRKRIEDLVRRQSVVLTSADVGAGYYLEQIKYAEISGYTAPQNWEKAVAQIEQALREAIRYGFTAAELERAKNDYKADLLKAAEEENTRDSRSLAGTIMAGIGRWHVVQSPGLRAQMLLPALNDVTRADVNRVFSDLWSAPHRLVLVTGNTEMHSLQAQSAKRIEQVYEASVQVAVGPPEEKHIVEFPYLPLPQSLGVVRQRQEIKDLGITSVQFENGVHLFLKPTRFKENQVEAILSFGSGEASEPEGQEGLAKLAREVVNESGFGSMDRSTLEDALNGRLAQTHFDIREDLFVVKGEAVTKELPLLFQLLHTFIMDPGIREEARQLSLRRFEQEYRRMSKNVEGVMAMTGRRFLAGGDRRFGEPQWDQLSRRSIKQIQRWLLPQLRNAPMELALVGDFDVERVLKLAKRYIGSLPSRQEVQKIVPVSGPRFPEGASLNRAVKTQTPKSLVVIAYPTQDFWDIQRTRRLSVMAELFSERLRQHVREKLGAAYSPYAYNRSYRAYKGYGMTQAFVEVAPNAARAIANEVRNIAVQLGTKAPDADEFRRILDPILTHIKDLRQENSYWLNSVLTGAACHPEQLDWARTFVDDYAAIKAEEITALARKYLANGKAATIILSPAADSAGK